MAENHMINIPLNSSIQNSGKLEGRNLHFFIFMYMSQGLEFVSVFVFKLMCQWYRYLGENPIEITVMYK